MSGDEVATAVKKGGGAFAMVGGVTLVLGMLCMAAPLATGLAITLMIGAMFLIGGIFQTVHSFKVFEGGSRVAAIVVGALTVAAGVLILSRPANALGTLTLILAIFFAVEGLLTILTALQSRSQKGWGWLLFSGLVSLVLGLIIWRQWPVSGIWAVGLLVGVRLITGGLTMIFVGSVTRGLGAAAEEADRLANERPVH